MKAVLPNKPVLAEPDAHVMMRHARAILRFLLIIAAVSTIVLLVFFRPAAYLAAIPIPVLFCILIIVGYLERQSRANVLRSPGQTSISQEETQIDVADAGIYTAIKIFALLALGTFIVAASMFEWEMVGIAAAVLFLLSIFITIPYLPIFIQEAARDEREKVTHSSPSNTGSNKTIQSKSEIL